MSIWPSLLRIPEHCAALGRADAWFAPIAERLLNGTALHVAGQPHRLVEIEFYLFSAEHPDPFTHRQPIPLESGHWHFHRTGEAYRNGTFKGLDLTHRNGTSYGGILIRSIVKPDGTIVDGPSLCVDHLLRMTGAVTIAELDRAIAGRPVWDADSPMSLRPARSAASPELLRTPRVGLSLRRAKDMCAMPRYLMLPYRFVGAPGLVRKGKRHMILALHARGDDAETIRRITGSPLASIRRCIEEFEVGKLDGDFAPYLGVEAGPREWCRMAGMWRRVFG